MMATASAAVHAAQNSVRSAKDFSIWECPEPNCGGHREKDGDGRNWTCKKCHVGTNKNKAVDTPRPVLVTSKGSPQGYKSGGQRLLEALEASHDADLKAEANSSRPPGWMEQRRIAGVRTYLSVARQ